MDLGHVLLLPRGLVERGLTVLLREKDLSEFLEREYSVLLYVMHLEYLLDLSICQGLARLCKGLSEVGWCDVAAVVGVKVLEEGNQLILGQHSAQFNRRRQELRVVYFAVPCIVKVLHYLSDLCSAQRLACASERFLELRHGYHASLVLVHLLKGYP